MYITEAGQQKQGLEQLHRLAPHLVIHIDIALGGGNRLMAGRASQHPHGHPFVGKACNKSAPARVATGIFNAGTLIER